jgi:3-oxoacyl-[acyl-carrier-protein] synthase-1
VLGVGARGHLGLNSLQIATGMRARLLEPREAPFPDRTGGGAGIARAECVPVEVVGFERFVRLGAPALREAASSCDSAALFLALPDADRPDQADPRFESELLNTLASRSGFALDAESRIVRHGHAGFGVALSAARDVLDSGRVDEVVVGGIDSAFHPEVVRWLDERGWLCREDDDAGRIPSEAAAFVRLARRPEGKAAPWGRPVAVDTIFSPSEAESPSDLGRLVRRVAVRGHGERVSWILPDLNGERPRAERWLKALEIARERVEGAFRDDPVMHLGDTGAATGGLLSVIALQLARIGAVQTHDVFVTTSSDRHEHAVMLWTLPDAGGPFTASRTDVRDHAVSGGRGAVRPDADESRHMWRAARSCLEDIGSMGMLLAPEPAEGDPQVFGQRLLDAFDALAALGCGAAGAVFEPDVAALVERYATETPDPDRARRFAVAFARAHLISKSRSGRSR